MYIKKYKPFCVGCRGIPGLPGTSKAIHRRPSDIIACHGLYKRAQRPACWYTQIVDKAKNMKIRQTEPLRDRISDRPKVDKIPHRTSSFVT